MKRYSFEEIKKEFTSDTNLTAFGDDNREYSASYSAEFKMIFFCIPASVNILWYEIA
jgi:hypothetical protein